METRTGAPDASRKAESTEQILTYIEQLSPKEAWRIWRNVVASRTMNHPWDEANLLADTIREITDSANRAPQENEPLPAYLSQQEVDDARKSLRAYLSNPSVAIQERVLRQNAPNEADELYEIPDERNIDLQLQDSEDYLEQAIAETRKLIQTYKKKCNKKLRRDIQNGKANADETLLDHIARLETFANDLTAYSDEMVDDNRELREKQDITHARKILVKRIDQSKTIFAIKNKIHAMFNTVT